MSNDLPPNAMNDILNPMKPVVPWPRVEGVEVDLNKIHQKDRADVGRDSGGGAALQEKNVVQNQYITFKPHTHVYTDPVLKRGDLGNLEPKGPEPPGILDGPGEGAKPFVLGAEYKEAVQASIKEFGFNMVASDMISLDRTISDLRHEE